MTTLETTRSTPAPLVAELMRRASGGPLYHQVKDPVETRVPTLNGRTCGLVNFSDLNVRIETVAEKLMLNVVPKEEKKLSFHAIEIAEPDFIVVFHSQQGMVVNSRYPFDNPDNLQIGHLAKVYLQNGNNVQEINFGMGYWGTMDKPRDLNIATTQKPAFHLGPIQPLNTIQLEKGMFDSSSTTLMSLGDQGLLLLAANHGDESQTKAWQRNSEGRWSSLTLLNYHKYKSSHEYSFTGGITHSISVLEEGDKAFSTAESLKEQGILLV